MLDLKDYILFCTLKCGRKRGEIKEGSTPNIFQTCIQYGQDLFLDDCKE